MGKLLAVTQWQQVTYLVRADSAEPRAVGKALQDPICRLATVEMGRIHDGNVIEIKEATMEMIQQAEPTMPNVTGEGITP